MTSLTGQTMPAVTAPAMPTPKSSASERGMMSVFEHQRLSRNDFVRATDFTWLLTQELPVFTSKYQRGQWQLKVGHYIGIIMLPSGIALEILPKPVAGTAQAAHRSHADILQTRHWVQQMLSDLMTQTSKAPHSTHFHQLSRPLTPWSEHTPPLSQWLAERFLQQLMHYQPAEYYASHTQQQSTLQGKLLIKQQLQRHAHQPHKFVCEINQRSTDMLSNRMIKTALSLLTPLLSAMGHTPLMSTHFARWRHLSALSAHEYQRLDTIYTHAKRQLQAQPVTGQQRQAATQLLDMAYWLLQQQRPHVPTGNGIAPPSVSPRHHSQPLQLCILIDMNQAFEQWASRRIAAQFETSTDTQRCYEAVYQPRDVWLQDQAGQTYLSVQPDVLIYNTMQEKAHAPENGAVKTARLHCSHVIDIKWKHLPRPTAISASDIYQLISYAQVYQSPNAWLVYPTLDAKAPPIALQSATTRTDETQAALWLMPFDVLTGSLNQA